MTKIDKRAFIGCKTLASITIPESVTEIGEWAFSGCEALKSIKIPESVTKIGNYAFDECKELKSIDVAEGNKVYDSRDNCNAIIKTKTNCLIQGFTSTVIPDSVTKIGDCAFSGREALTSINIPKSVTEIDNSAFQECEALTSVTLPESVAKIGYWVFCDCENLKEIVLRHTDPSQIDVSDAGNLGAEQATLYVPKEGVAAFQKDPFWSKCAAAIKPITDDMLK